MTEHFQLPEPYIDAPDRIWKRFENTRARSTSIGTKFMWTGGGLALAAAALVAIWGTRPEVERVQHLVVEAEVQAHDWGDDVDLEVLGAGMVTGTDHDLEVAWTTGTLRAEVTPNSGTTMSVRTDEALVQVVGTRFAVDRNALGSTVSVDRGKVEVTCDDGWTGTLGADQAHTCLPVTAAGLLGRADALIDDNNHSALGHTLDEGIARAEPGNPALGELLVRRIQHRRDSGDIDGALADARRYTDADIKTRRAQVQRAAAWIALADRGCETATPWLTALHDSGSVEETVLLAECVAADDAEAARELVMGVLTQLEGTWSDRAVSRLSRL